MQVNSFFPNGPGQPMQFPSPPVDHCRIGQPPPYSGPPSYGPAMSQQQFADFHQGYQQLGQGWQGVGAGPPGGPPRPRVAVIDDFGSNHGFEMQNALNANGSDTLALNINQPGANRTTMVANALQDVAARLDRGEKVDAVSLSQQDFGGSPDDGRIAQLTQYIQQRYGVPVVVAAGNGGAGASNQLAQGAALVAENTVPGTNQLEASSGRGNIAQQAPTTSLATALVAARAAQLRNQGVGLQGIVADLQQQANQQGGTL